MAHFTFQASRRGLSRHLLRSMASVGLGLGALLLSLTPAALAGDPFRVDEPHNISDISEQAFYAMFRDGDYLEAREYLDSADVDAANDPLFHALGAAFAYLDEDWDTLAEKASMTKSVAADLSGADPLRSNLYEAVGIFLEGAYILQTEGIAQGTPKALGMLQQVFDRMEAAEEIDPSDPELSLLKGYMDLLLAVNLPFANPERAIDRLETFGYPTYVAYRGIALGYRDLDRNTEALTAIDVALDAAPQNPDLLYLKAQILRRLDRDAESVDYFNQALTYADQLHSKMRRQVVFEHCKATGESRDTCNARADSQQ